MTIQNVVAEASRSRAVACATMHPTTSARMLNRSPAQPPTSWPATWITVISATTPAAWPSE